MAKRYRVWFAQSIAWVAVGVLFGTPLPSSAQVPTFDSGDEQNSFLAMAEYLARDGGRWRGANPNFDGSANSPPEFGLLFERHLDGRVLQIQIVVHYADRTVLSSHGQWTWHPGRNEVSYIVTDRGGGVSEGVTTFPNGATFRTDATRAGPDGEASPHRDDNVLVTGSLHRNETFSWVDGAWVSGGVYEWHRDLAAAPDPVAGDAVLLDLPPRAVDAELGSDIVADLGSHELEEREARVFREISTGNVPSRLRALVRVDMMRQVGGRSYEVSFWVTPDYLAVGSDEDFFRTPLSPQTAQRIADQTGTSLLTTVMVDAVWDAATVKLEPAPIPPSDSMTTVPVFEAHDRTVREMLMRRAAAPGAIVAGHKKDVVLTPRLDTLPGKVAIYGWHELDGVPIQPLYTGHTDRWVDYSHGIRLVSRRVLIDGEARDLVQLLQDPELAPIVTNEGAMVRAAYSLIPAPSSRR